MKEVAFCLFETPLGSCGIAWSEGKDSCDPPAVSYFQLPEATTERTAARIARTCGGGSSSPPPPPMAEVIEKITRHLQGEVQDFQDIAVDLDGVRLFDQQVYKAARNIPIGQTRSYGELAKTVNHPGAARAVGQALGRNPIALIIPCHRVLAAGGKIGGFSAHGGLATKRRMLALEGVVFG